MSDDLRSHQSRRPGWESLTGHYKPIDQKTPIVAVAGQRMRVIVEVGEWWKFKYDVSKSDGDLVQLTNLEFDITVYRRAPSEVGDIAGRSPWDYFPIREFSRHA